MRTRLLNEDLSTASSMSILGFTGPGSAVGFDCLVRSRRPFLPSGVQAAVAIGVSFVDDSLTYVSITSCRKAALSLQEPLPPLSSPSIIDRSCLPPALLLLPFSSFSLSASCALAVFTSVVFALLCDGTGRDDMGRDGTLRDGTGRTGPADGTDVEPRRVDTISQVSFPERCVVRH